MEPSLVELVIVEVFQWLFPKLLICGPIAVFPAVIASRRGDKFWVWWVYGVLMPPVAIVHCLIFRFRYDRRQRAKQKAAQAKREATFDRQTPAEPEP